MASQTIELTLPSTMIDQLESEVSAGKFSTSTELISDVLSSYLDDRRIERMVSDGLRDENVTPLTQADFGEMKRELVERFRETSD